MAEKRKKKQKPEVKTRLKRVLVDVSQLAGPYFLEGELGKKMPSISEPVWYEPEAGVFVLRDGTLAFDAKPTKYTAQEKSARSIQREKVLEDLALKQGKVNVLSERYDRASTPAKKAEIRKQIKAAEVERDKVKVELSKVQTSTQKIEEKTQAYETRPVFGRSAFSQGKLPVLAEFDRKSDKVKLFFMGAREQDGKIKCSPKFKQCMTVVPVVRSMLAKYTDPSTPSRGELGYFAIPSWDWPKVKNELRAYKDVRLFGAPEYELQKKFSQLDARAKRVSEKTILIPPNAPPKVGRYEDGSPAPFQLEGIKFLMSRDYAILADDMGLGKTYQAVVAAHSSVPKTQQILILCPAAVVGNWLGDIAVFAPGAGAIGFTSQWVDKNGQPSARPEKVRFFVCSYQGATSQEGKAAVSKFLLGHKWGLVVLDEAHRLKKPTTLSHKFVDMLNTTRMWLLTGTPIANNVIDYYGLLKLAKHPIGKNEEKFTEEYIPGAIKAGKLEISESLEPLRKLGRDLVGYVLRRTKEEVLKKDLPTKYGGIAQMPRGFIRYSLPADFAKALKDANESGQSREAIRHALAVAKVPGTWEVAQRVIDAGDKVVLFSTYTDVLQALAEFCNDAKVLYIVISGAISTVGKSAMVKLFQGETLSSKEGQDEEKWAKKNLGQWFLNLVRHVPVSEWKPEDIAEATKRFGKDERKWPHDIQVVLGQMVAASEGVTLTKADTLLFNDLDYMPSRHEQAEDRIYRLSKPDIPPPHNAVFIGYVYANDPAKLDQNILTGLQAKRAEIQTVYGHTSKDADGEYAKLRKKFIEELKGKKRNPSDGGFGL